MKLLLMIFVGAHLMGGAFAAEKVVIEGDDDYAPYSYVENGQFKGIYVDFLKVVARKLAPAYDVELRPMPWKRGLKNLETGESLALFPPYHNKERAYIESYSTPIYRESVVLFCNQNVIQKNPKKFPDDFAGLKVGNNLGFVLGETMKAAVTAKVFTLVEARGNEDNLWNLHSGQIDCYAIDRLAAHFSALKLHDNPRFLGGKDFKLQEAIEVSGQDVFIGYSATSKHAYKADFIKKMNVALEDARKAGIINKLITASVRPVATKAR